MDLSGELVLIVVLVVCALHYLMGNNRVEGMETIKQCNDIAQHYSSNCERLLVDDYEECSNNYTISGGKEYFCVWDPDAYFFKCKRDDKVCTESTDVQVMNRIGEWVTKEKTFIHDNCDKCGGCGKILDKWGRALCKDDDTKWCWCR